MVKLSKFDAADYLKTPEAIAAYLTEAFESDDASYICTALDTVARAKGVAGIASATGLSRESLYKAFRETARPEFETVRKVMGSLGLRLVAEPMGKSGASSRRAGENLSARTTGQRTSVTGPGGNTSKTSAVGPNELTSTIASDSVIPTTSTGSISEITAITPPRQVL